VATKLKDLKLDDAHATAVLEKAIEYESFTEDMPSSKRERIKAATDQVALMIDAWVDDEVTPENEDPDVAAMGEAISEIFEIAGVEVDEDGEVSYGEPGDIEEPEEEDEDEPEEEEEEGGDDEAPVDIEDVVEGYDDLSAASRVKAIKALELDMEDDDDYNTAVRVYEYEEAQDKPSSRVLSFLDDLLPKDADAGEAEEEEEEEPDEDEDAEEAGDGDGEEDGEWEAPWDKYDKQTAVEVKKHLDKLLAKDELTADMAQYVIDYETAREKPPTRKRVVDYATKLLEQLEGAEEEEPEEEEEEAKPPKRSKRPANAKRPARGSKKPAKQEEPDEEEPEEEEDEAPAGNGGGIFVISGGDEDITAYGIYGAMGAVADLLAAGYEEVTVSAG
jgi:hypothetical protein